MPEAEPYSLDYWVARTSAKDIVQSLFRSADEAKINEVLGFLGQSRVTVGDGSVPGQNIGDLLIVPTV